MNSKLIKLEDFPELVENPPFDVDPCIYQIYCWFQENEQDCLYYFDEDISSKISVTNTLLYQNFGIFISEEEMIYQLEEGYAKSRYIFSIDIEDILSINSFKSSLIQFQQELNLGSERIYCVIKTDLYADSRRFEQLRNLYPSFSDLNFPVDYANKAFKEMQRELLMRSYVDSELAELQKTSKYVLYNVADLIESSIYSPINGTTTEALYVGYTQLINELQEQIKSNNILYYKCNNRDMTNLWVPLAAHLAFCYNAKVYINVTDRSQFIGELNKYTSQNYNTLDGFLDTYKNFPNYTFNIINNSVNCYIRNLKEEIQNPQSYGIFLTFMYAEIDVKNLCLVSELSRIETQNLKDITYLNFKEILPELVSDELNTALNADASMNKLLTEFEHLLRANNHIVSQLLSCTNLLFFTKNNRTYLAYVSSIYMKLPFMVYSTLTHSFVPRNLELRDLLSLVDHRAFIDGKEIINTFFSKCGIPTDNLVFKHSHLKGSPLLFCKISKTPLLHTDLTLEDAGIWSYQTSSMRSSSNGEMFKSIDIDMLRKYNYVSFFGSISPLKSAEITITPELWLHQHS